MSVEELEVTSDTTFMKRFTYRLERFFRRSFDVILVGFGIILMNWILYIALIFLLQAIPDLLAGIIALLLSISLVMRDLSDKSPLKDRYFNLIWFGLIAGIGATFMRFGWIFMINQIFALLQPDPTGTIILSIQLVIGLASMATGAYILYLAIPDSYREKIVPYLYLVPSFLLIIAFVYLPILTAMIVSFFNNPGLVDISENLVGYYTNTTNVYYVGLGTFLQDMVTVGFLPVIHVLSVIFGTIIGKKLISRNKPDLNQGVAYSISLLVNLVISTLLMTISINVLIGTGATLRVPIRNYYDVFTRQTIIGDFLKILLNTFLWSVICTFFHVIFGMLLAVLLNTDFPGRKFFRTSFILPWAVPSFITALIWKNFIFDANRGILGRPASNSLEVGSEWVFTILDLILLLTVIGFAVYMVFSREDQTRNGRIIKWISLIVLTVIFLLVYGMDGVGIKFLDNHFIKISDISPKFYYSSDLFILGFQTKTIFLAAIITNIWIGVPFMMLSFSASLQSIPPDLYEAAELDGASAWGRFRSVTFPFLVPTLRTVALLGIVWTFNLFNVFYILAQNQTGLGRRESYDIFITYIYYLFRQGTAGRPEFSAAAALSFIVFGILVLFSRVYNMIFKEEL